MELGGATARQLRSSSIASRTSCVTFSTSTGSGGADDPQVSLKPTEISKNSSSSDAWPLTFHGAGPESSPRTETLASTLVPSRRAMPAEMVATKCSGLNCTSTS